MSENEYNGYIHTAMNELMILRMATKENMLQVALRIPVKALEAAIAEEVYYDDSVLKNYPDEGKPVAFYPQWINICKETLIDRLLLE